MDDDLHRQRGLKYGQNPADNWQHPGNATLENGFVVPQCQQVEHHDDEQQYNDDHLLPQIVFVESDNCRDGRDSGAVKIAGAMYSIETGLVEFFG